MRLKIFRVKETCIFELGWGQGQQLMVEVDYPESLTALYQTWHNAYLDYYSHWQAPVVDRSSALPESDKPSRLRARVQSSGSLAGAAKDRRKTLVDAEDQWLRQFHQWLNSSELLPVRSTIAQAEGNVVDVFITCKPIELEYLPWETWNIGTEFGSRKTIRFARTPTNLRHEPGQTRRKGQARILAILGDSTGLDFQAEVAALKNLAVSFVGGQPDRPVTDLKTEIIQAITDPLGWDVIFFAGHSDETTYTGGELAIAPGQSILVQEIAPHLLQAKATGLQFAIFNSCKGLRIANALVDLGLSQVAIMREPIHNQVAQLFFTEFMRQLEQFANVHEALCAACEFLKRENDRTLHYPSAYLIPSLFRHPEVPLFRLTPTGWRHRIAPWLPSRKQAVALTAIAGLSVIVPVQDLLLDSRLGLQAIYRNVTQQIPVALPPTLLVQIDEASIRDRGLDARKINPIDRSYLGDVLNQIPSLQAARSGQATPTPKVIGIDFLLDRPTQEDLPLQRAIAQATQRGNLLVFAAIVKGQTVVGVRPNLAQLEANLQGNAFLYPWTVELPSSQGCDRICPLGYTLALASLTQAQQASQTGAPERLQFLSQQQFSPWVDRVRKFGQSWFQPILDFSIPPDRVYRTISAQQLFHKQLQPEDKAPAIVLIAPGGYDEAGLNGRGEDNFPVPAAIAYWSSQVPAAIAKSSFTGAEAHAYMVHHLLQQRLVIPIPDFLMIALAGLGGQLWIKVDRRRVQRNQYRTVKIRNFAIVAGIYGLVSLQTFITVSVLLPYFLPIATLGLYVIPALKKSTYDSSF
ncbi:CHASE2 domain-containing protein [Alkalinema pantanalense CENA528]|uniref:CHASE2 domain-containing protein n=1 Tax=Alkalinema pantanalense TaxID=1620705 RepID=UPI003D6E8DDD